MTIKKNATGSGAAPQMANAIIGGVSTTTAGAGTTSLNASLLPLASNHWVTVGVNNSGVILPPGNGTGDSLAAGDYMSVINLTGNTLLVYPPAGGKISTGAANASVSLTNGKQATFMCLDGTNYSDDL